MHKPIDITAGNTLPPVGAPWSVSYAYTFGGHKFLKETELEGETPEVRLYLGGAEFVNGQPESYYHGEGRVALTGDKPAFQYKLTDHLGNTMVLFEDKDGDGIITTESNPAENEVLQRNFYYAFGLPMQGPWNHTPTDPDMPYLYNGKELEGELGLGWYAYGFRYYDASVGRFVGVDPLAGKMPDWSPFGYGYSNPISFIDFMGLAPEATYSVDKKGNIKKIDDVDHKDADGNSVDILIRSDDVKGYLETGAASHKVEVSPKLLGQTQRKREMVRKGGKSSFEYTSISLGNDGETATKLFEFAADNSEVEWSLMEFAEDFGTVFQITTTHEFDSDEAGSSLAFAARNKLMLHTHSHPNRGIMNDHSRMEPSFEDRKFAKALGRRGSKPKLNVYFDGKYYDYSLN
jgi:RHS repeat-associated protein